MERVTKKVLQYMSDREKQAKQMHCIKHIRIRSCADADEDGC